MIFVGRWPDSLGCFRDGSDKPGKLPRFSLFVMADGLDANSCVISEGVWKVELRCELFYGQKNRPLVAQRKAKAVEGRARPK